MGLRGRLESSARRLGEVAGEVAASGPIQSAGDHVFSGLRGVIGVEDSEKVTAEHFLLTLVRAVRDDETAEDRSERDVHKSAKRRRRRLGLLSLGTGPMVGVTSKLVDLYSDTATVADLANAHDLTLSDEQIAAHMLELWNVARTPEEARAAIDGSGPATGEILVARLRERADERIPDELTKWNIVKALWQARDIPGEVAEAAAGGGVKAVVFSGRHATELISRAEVQLGVAPPEAV